MAPGIQKQTSTSGISVSYTTYNLPIPQSHPPVLCFVHGWCCSSNLWSAQAPLYNSHPSILIDLPGHGESDKPSDVEYSMEFFAQAIDAVLEAESVAEVVLIGHSMGGCISTMFLRWYGRQKVKGIIYVSSFWLMPVHYLTRSVRQAWTATLKDDEKVMELFEAAWTAKSSTSMIERVRETMCRRTPMHVRLGSVAADCLPPHWQWNEVYADIPMLQITYEHAPEWDDQSQHHLPRLVTERWTDVSVFLFMEEPDRFNERVEIFLQQNELL